MIAAMKVPPEKPAPRTRVYRITKSCAESKHWDCSGACVSVKEGMFLCHCECHKPPTKN